MRPRGSSGADCHSVKVLPLAGLDFKPKFSMAIPSGVRRQGVGSDTVAPSHNRSAASRNCSVDTGLSQRGSVR